MLVTAANHARDAFVAKPTTNREASLDLARTLFPDESFTPLEDGDLYSTSPNDDELVIGRFENVSIIAAKEFGGDYPSQLPQKFIAASGRTTLHAMHSAVDWFAFAHWVDGKLVRALSLSPDSGILEDIGAHLDFEKPYWNGEFPAVEGDEEEYPFDFHPLDLGEAALLHFFGYQIEGFTGNNLFAPEEISLLRLKRAPAETAKLWWQFW